MFVRPDNWDKMTPLERRAARLDSWQNVPVEFASPEAEANYKERIERLRKIYDMEPHDRPIADAFMGANEYVGRRGGLIGKDFIYNHEKMFEPFVQFHREFQPDVAIGTLPYPGHSWDILDFQLYAWGGQKLGDNMVIQAIEGERMSADEYKDFIADPTSFWLKQYLPRAYPALAPLAMLPEFTRISESIDTIDLLMPFAMPPFQEMLKKLTEAAGELMKTLGAVGQTMGTITAEGFPAMGLNIVKTPFDYLGDTLRGTKGILMDMFRHPDDLLAACEAYVPILIKSIVATSDRSNAPAALYVLHKGADTFMSDAQFKKFYWPTWKKVMMGLYEEGITNYLFIEGSYNTRLEYLAEMPEKSLVCHFDKTEMGPVKEILADKHIIAGNVPASLMSAGTTEEVRDYCGELVDLFDGDAYMMAHGCYFENTTDDKMRAFFDSVKK